jgi:hypothetical protein
MWDPWVDKGDTMEVVKKYDWDKEPQLYFIGCKHEVWKHFYFKKDDVVIDPFRYLNLPKDVKYIPIGKHGS